MEAHDQRCSTMFSDRPGRFIAAGLAAGAVDSTTITAARVILEPPTSASTAAATVVPFTRGTAGSAKSVGEIPANYEQGSGAILGGTTADTATEAALTAYPRNRRSR